MTQQYQRQIFTRPRRAFREAGTFRRRLGWGMIRFNYCRRRRCITSGNPSKTFKEQELERTYGGS